MNQSSHDWRLNYSLECGSAVRINPEAPPRTMNTDHGIGPNGQVNGTVLVVEDAQSMGLSLQIILSSFRVAVVRATRSEDVVSIIRNANCDAALLNLNEPGIRGTDICCRLRKHLPRLQILMLGDSNDEDQVLEAFEAGADDYIAKPFRHRDLIARLNAAIRRERSYKSYDAVINVGDISLDFSRRLAKKKGRLIHLTPTQFKLLHFLMTNLGKALPHARLLMHVWGPEYGGELEYLRTFVRQLRKKLEDDPAKPRYLLTESHFGYRFNEVA
jgi:two-component system, OmpR family, KDP operon response regulator KdpE